MKRTKGLLLSLVLLLSVPFSLASCSQRFEVSKEEIEKIENEEYALEFNSIHPTYKTYLLINKARKKDTYYQIGPSFFKSPYDFSIILKNKYFNTYKFLKESYMDDDISLKQVIYLSYCQRQFMKSFTELPLEQFNLWYDKGQRMEISHYSNIDYSIIGEALYGPTIYVTLKNEESIKFKQYTKEDFPMVKDLLGVGKIASLWEGGHMYDDNGEYDIRYSTVFKNVKTDYRKRMPFYIGATTDVNKVKRAIEQIKSYSFVYDIELQEYKGSIGFTI